jgi:hypothetical protein
MGKIKHPITLAKGKPMAKGRVDISASLQDGLIVVRLAGGTDEIAIDFKITGEEARKLVHLLNDLIKRA